MAASTRDFSAELNPEQLAAATHGDEVGQGVPDEDAEHRGRTGVAERLGGRRIYPNTTDPVEQRVLNVVEEMAIASGIPAPEIYVLEAEQGINAFAAGYAPVSVLLPLLTLPVGILLLRAVYAKTGSALNATLANTAKLLLGFGVLFGVGLAAGALGG